MLKDAKGRLVVAISFLFDIPITIFAVYFAMILSNVPAAGHSYIKYILSFTAFIVFYFYMFELYSVRVENIYNSVLSAGLSVIASTVSVFFVSLLFAGKYPPILFWILAFVFLGAGLVVWRMLIAFVKKKFGKKRKMLIIENMNNTSRLARKLKYASNAENQSWYCMLDENNEEEIQALIDTKMDDFDVIFISPAISSKVSMRIEYHALMKEKTVNILTDVYSVTTMKGKIYQIDDTPVIEKETIHLTKMQKFIKRLFDIVFSLIVCVVTLPIFVICAVCVKLDSKGPIIYKQERYTIHKKVFNCYKFRTMVADAEAAGAQFATENDPRITKVGKVLRSLRLDELPQIYNILFGHMSVVGPRPERPVFADEFAKTVANYDMRHCLKAGLTGYAQVYGRYNTRVSDKILMDMIYGTTYSFFLDIKIILLTVRVMFTKSATAGVDEQSDIELSAQDKEEARRTQTADFIGGSADESISDSTRV